MSGFDYAGETNAICFSCFNAAGGCSWADDLIPVEGWTAIYNPKLDGYHIISCPKYEKGDRLWSRKKETNACKSSTTSSSTAP